MFLCDYHMHSDNSTDGNNTIEQMCAAATKVGLNEIAISDHFEPTTGNENYSWYNKEKYFREIQKANELYNKELKIKRAVELGQPHLFQESSLKLITSNPYDYVLGSAHKMADNVDFGDLRYNAENLTEYCNKYLDELENLAGWNQFDCLAHLDLIKRYAAKFNLSTRLIDYKDRMETILRTIIYNGKGIEVNTSGLRQLAKECLPGLDIIEFYKQLGGEIITIGSDAHNSDDVGKGIMEAVELIRNAGFKYITIYNDRKPEMIKISYKRSVYFVPQKTA